MSQQEFMKLTYTCLCALPLLRPHFPQQLWTSLPQAAQEKTEILRTFSTQSCKADLSVLTPPFTIMAALNFRDGLAV